MSSIGSSSPLPGGANVLPSLTGAAGGAGGVGADGGASPSASALLGGAVPTGGQQAAQGGGELGAPKSGSSGLSGIMKWVGPAAVVGGAFLAFRGLKAAPPSTAMQIGGGVLGALGLGGTILAFQADGAKKGREQGVAETSNAVMQAIDAGMLGPGAGAGSTGAPAGPGMSTAAMLGGGEASDPTSAMDPSAQAAAGGDPTTGGGPTTAQEAAASIGMPGEPEPVIQSQAPPIDPASWTSSALIGSAVDLTAGATSTGGAIADAGPYVLSGVLGDPNGYASLAEADQAAKGAMTTEMMGTKDHRWVVVEHGGRYYAYAAKVDATGATPKLPSANGNLAAWHALRYVDDGMGNSQWMTYDWAQGTGAAGQFAGAPIAGAQPVGSSVTGGGPVASGPSGGPVAGSGVASPVAPTSVTAALMGRGFNIDDDSRAPGGWLQLQGVAPGSEAGFGTVEEAAASARQARAADAAADVWKRWVSVRAQDGRFYVLHGHIVNTPTPPVSGAQPAHVFGAGFAEYYDGSRWRAQPDA